MGTGAEIGKGALGGAATGAAIGSILPGPGTAIGAGAGAVLGGIAGYLGGSNDPNREDFNMPDYERRRQQALLGANQATNQQGQARGFQTQQLGALQGYANGTNSVSMAQLNQARDANVRNQMALAASSRPGQGAMGARLAQQQIGSLNQQAAQQAVAAGLQERYAANQLLSGHLSGMRGQDMDREAMLRQLEFQNARQQQLGAMGFNQTQAGMPTLGDQLMGAGTASLGLIGTQG